MEAACKHLREGLVRESLGSALVVVHDGLDVVGGRDVLVQLSQAFIAAVAAERAQASRVSLLALEKDPGIIAEQQQQHVITVLDAHRLMHGWDADADGQGADDDAACSFSSLEELERLLLQRRDSHPGRPAGGASAAAAPPEHSVAIIIDSLSQLLLQYPHQRVLSFLSRLQSNPAVSCILTSIHRDLHEQQVIAGMEYLSTCSIQLQPLGRLHQEVAARHTGINPHGCISFRYKRRAGRVNVESLLYTLMASGTIRMSAPPAALAAAITAESLVALSVNQQPWSRGQQPAAGAAAQPHLTAPAAAAATAATPNNAAAPPGASFKPVAGGMKMDLPVAAGGHSAVRHVQDSAAALVAHGPDSSDPSEVSRLGHILYVRDSEEEHDSDEDPDDDLDI